MVKKNKKVEKVIEEKVEKKGAEKRQFVRIDLKNLVKVEEYQIGGDKEKQINSLVKNISAGGLLFTTNHKFEIGALIKLDVNIPGWSKHKVEFLKENRLALSDPFVALATVVRVEVLEFNKEYEIGACFVNIYPDHLDALMKYIEAYQNK